MTISSTTTKISYNGAGSAGPFSIPFYFLANADLVATKVSTTGVESTLALTTHYTLTGAGVPAGGTLTLVSVLASGEKLIIKRSPAKTQETDYVENAAFPAEAHEEALDRLTMITQDLGEVMARAVTIPISSSVTPTDYLTTVEGHQTAAAASASTATTQAGIATTQAGLASASAVAAAASAAALPNAASIGAGKVPQSDGTAWTGVTAGDMVKADNLSGLANTTTARSNLGLAIGTNVQAYDADICISDVTKSYTKTHYPVPVALSSASAHISFDNSIHAYATHTMTETTNLDAPSNRADGQAGLLVVTGASTYTLSATATNGWKMVEGTSFNVSLTAGKKTWIYWECNGTQNLIVGTKQEA